MCGFSKKLRTKADARDQSINVSEKSLPEVYVSYFGYVIGLANIAKIANIDQELLRSAKNRIFIAKSIEILVISTVAPPHDFLMMHKAIYKWLC